MLRGRGIRITCGSLVNVALGLANGGQAENMLTGLEWTAISGQGIHSSLYSLGS